MLEALAFSGFWLQNIQFPLSWGMSQSFQRRPEAKVRTASKQTYTKKNASSCKGYIQVDIDVDVEADVDTDKKESSHERKSRLRKWHN